MPLVPICAVAPLKYGLQDFYQPRPPLIRYPLLISKMPIFTSLHIAPCDQFPGNCLVVVARTDFVLKCLRVNVVNPAVVRTFPVPSSVDNSFFRRVDPLKPASAVRLKKGPNLANSNFD